MKQILKSRALLLVLLTTPVWSPISAAAQKTDTFVITVALPAPTIHVGDALSIEETLSNPTDHVVVAGNGLGVGSTWNS
jgi:hypothetical protein